MGAALTSRVTEVATTMTRSIRSTEGSPTSSPGIPAPRLSIATESISPAASASTVRASFTTPAISSPRWSLSWPAVPSCRVCTLESRLLFFMLIRVFTHVTAVSSTRAS
ncbi:Uncharacterised protein [Mycobacteroides abscessus subsp. abscessus]|nr:Uncharacterised protein [Mycobacteroides abscessus subsp. abscessus]